MTFPVPSPFLRQAPIMMTGCLMVILSLSPQGQCAEEIASEATQAAVPEIKDTSFQEGLNSLKNNLPLIASKQFKRSLEKQNGKLDLIQQNIIKGYLAESLIRSDAAKEALDILTQLPQTQENSYWTAIALIKQGKLTDALKWLAKIEQSFSSSPDKEKPEDNKALRHLGANQVPGLNKAILEAKAYIGMALGDNSLLLKSMETLAGMEESPGSLKARVWLADTLVQKGEPDKAIEMLKPFLQQASPGKSSSIEHAVNFLRPYALLVTARGESRKGQWEEATRRMEPLIRDKNLPSRVRELAQIAQASVQILKTKETEANKTVTNTQSPGQETAPVGQVSTASGEDQIVSFIASHPDSPLLIDAFNILLREKTFLSNPQALEKLYSWVKSDNENRFPIASYALATTLYEKKDLAGAIKVVEASMEKIPDSPVTYSLVLKALYWLLKADQAEQAEQLLGKYPLATSAQVLFSKGCIAYQKGEFEKAEKLFNETAKLGDDRIITPALYNSNMAAMDAGSAKSQSDLLAGGEVTPGMRERLLYEQAHYLARKMQPEAISKLSAFIATHPHSKLLIPARLDLVEVCLNQTPPDTSFAQKQLEELANIKLNEEELFRIACLRVLLDEVQQNLPQAIAGCRGILKSFPNRPEADTILLKLGDLLYRNGDFNETLLVLQALPVQYPQSEYIPAALFLAGKAAQLCNTDSSLKKALELFRQLSQGNGAFSQSAQIEIASLFLRRGQAQEAIDLLDKMLSGQNLSKQTRLLALSSQADAWASLSGSIPNALVKAQELCTEMLSMNNLKMSWKFKALSQRAQYAEKAGNLDAALSDYAEILQYMDEITTPNRRDWYWFYNAGFASLHLLEMQKKWDDALALASRLAQTTGPKAREAANIARKIKLEHFIWTNVDENESDKLHQKDVQLPILKPLSK